MPSRPASLADNSILASPNPSERQSEAPESVNRSTVSASERALVILTIAGLAVLPVIFMTGVYDYFRVIKEAAFRAQAILGLFFIGLAVAARGTERLREMARERAVMTVLAGVVVWSAITAVLSTNRHQTAESLITIACSVALFVSVWYAARSVPVAALLILAPVSIVNAVLTVLQEYGIWSPFDFTLVSRSYAPHLATSALLGNPNDVGAYLALSGVILLAAAQHLSGWRRWTAYAGGVCALGGMLASETRTAFIAAAAALIVLAARKSRIAILLVLAVILCGFVAAAFTRVPLFSRVLEMQEFAMRGEWGSLISGRDIAFIAAIDMFRQRPIAGLGPGTFKSHYMDSRTDLVAAYPRQLSASTPSMFGEAHNDHLQLLAEGGIPAYLLFLAAMLLIARGANRGTERGSAAATIGAIAVTGFVVVALAFFPLQIAVTRHLMLTVGALVIGWKSE